MPITIQLYRVVKYSDHEDLYLKKFFDNAVLLNEETSEKDRKIPLTLKMIMLEILRHRISNGFLNLSRSNLNVSRHCKQIDQCTVTGLH